MPRSAAGSNFGTVQRDIHIVEMYVPGLREMQADRYAELWSTIGPGLELHGETAVVVLMPNDEVMLVLTWDRVANRTTSVGGVVVQRVVDGYLIFPYDRRET